MSLRPGFIVSRVHCVPGSLCLQLVCNCFFQLFCPPKMQIFATLFCNLFCNFLLLFVAKSGQKVGGKSCNKLAKSCNKLAKKKLHKSCKHIEPGTQWTRDTKTCFQIAPSLARVWRRRVIEKQQKQTCRDKHRNNSPDCCLLETGESNEKTNERKSMQELIFIHVCHRRSRPPFCDYTGVIAFLHMTFLAPPPPPAFFARTIQHFRARFTLCELL